MISPSTGNPLLHHDWAGNHLQYLNHACVGPNTPSSNVPYYQSPYQQTTRFLQAPSVPARPKPELGMYVVALLRHCDPRVSKCYGCKQALNPTLMQPSDDMVIASKQYRTYFKDGKEHTSPEPSINGLLSLKGSMCPDICQRSSLDPYYANCPIGCGTISV